MHLANQALSSCSLVLTTALLGLFGCADEAELEPLCSWVISKDECPGNETGGDDGDNQLGGDDDGAEAGPLCVAVAKGYERTVHQCDGSLSVAISFNTLLGDCGKTLGNPALCSELHLFGPTKDAYEMPAVMACCSPFKGEDQGTYLQYCAADMIEQLCKSIPVRLQKYIDDGRFAIGENQAQKLQNWLAKQSSQQDCYNTLYEASMDPDSPGQLSNASWLVNKGNNSAWTLLNDFTITVNSGVVDTVSLPEDTEQHIACSDNSYNNTELFEDTIPRSPGIHTITTMASAGSATVFGPELLGGRVHGVGRLSSLADSCQAPWCSTLEITADRGAGQWTLEELELFADGAVSLSNGSVKVLIERSAIRLYHVGLGTIRPDRSGALVYTLDTRAANFVITGVGGDVYDLRWAVNASPITARMTAKGWVLDSFVIEHEDSKGQRWVVTVGATSWESP